MRGCKLKDGKCPICGGDRFLADEIKAWECESRIDENGETVLHCFKCLESETANITCAKCENVEIDPDSTQIYYD